MFSEDQGRAVVSCAPERVGAVIEIAQQYGVPAAVIGVTGGDRLVISEWIDLTLSSLREAWEADA